MDETYSMSAAEVLQVAKAAGVRVNVDGEDLVLQAPAEPPPTVIEALTRHKADIVTLLRFIPDEWSAEDWQAFYVERAGILEFDSGIPRPEAEARAFELCVIEWLIRNPVPSREGRCSWCGGHESQSAVVLPFGTEQGPHTWLHSECWGRWHGARRAEAVKTLSLSGILPSAAPSDRP